MANFLKKERRFLIRSYRKLEILLLIFDDVAHADEICRMLPISVFTLYKLLKRYRMQGLIRADREKRFGRFEWHFEVTMKGLRWMLYVLQEEWKLRDERGLDIEKIDILIDRLVNRITWEEEREKRLYPYLTKYG